MNNNCACLISLICLTVITTANLDARQSSSRKSHISDLAESEQVVPVVTDLVKTTQNQDDEIYTIDTIKVVLFGEERTDIITQSDVERPSLDGRQRSLEDLVLERAMYQDAARYKMLPSEDAVDKRLQAVQRENNLTQDDLKKIFRSSGYTYEEGRDLFAIMTAVGTVLDFKIMSRLIVPEKDIIGYYQEHPVMQDASFQLERALVMCPDRWSNDDFKSELKTLIETGKSRLEVDWSSPFWVNKKDLAVEKQFIVDMEPCSIAIVQETAAGVELLKLNIKREERLMSLEDRYHEIADMLKRPKYEEMFTSYKNELLNASAVLYF
jgi:hypothetical protein